MSGKNKITQASMDGIAICDHAVDGLAGHLKLINKAEEADLLNDPYLQEADDQLRKALEFDDLMNIKSCIARARNALTMAKSIDFSDDSVHKLKNNLTYLQPLLEKCEAAFRKINSGFNPQPKQQQETNLI